MWGKELKPTVSAPRDQAFCESSNCTLTNMSIEKFVLFPLRDACKNYRRIKRYVR